MAKTPTTVYVCQKCGHQSRKWLGKCPDCGEWNSFAEERARPQAKDAGASGNRGGFQLRQVKPIAYGAIESQDESRTSSGITEFDRVLGGGIVPGSLILIGGEPGIGKCLVGSTRLIDPISGAYASILEWANGKRSVVSLDEDNHRLRAKSTTAFHDQGVQPVVEVKTKFGRTLRCTPGHPVLTPDGWRGVEHLRPGARIAAPRALPYFGNAAMEEHEVKLIAYVLSDGSVQAAEMATPAARFLKATNLRFTKAQNKAVPDVIFRLPREQMALFLKIIFSCDGSVYANKNNQPGVSYSTISKQLAEDVQHLLLRFGFVAKLRTKHSVVNNLTYVAYELQMLGEHAAKRFLSEIGIWGRDGAQTKIRSLPASKTPSTQSDTIPTGAKFWQHFKEVTAAAGDTSFKKASARVGLTLHANRDERPLCRATVAALANAYPTPYLESMARGDVYWDEIQSITPIGSERVYDISVPDSANFVANDLIVHNSTLLAQVADKLSSNSESPVLYISGEESERQIKMRGERLGLTAENLFLLPETNLENIFDEIARMNPGAIIVDSVQTVYTAKIESAPGSVSQVREVAGQFLMLAKNSGIPVFLIGHVTKEGSIAGPKTLEHIVDTVLYFEGERHHNHRIVRAAKNRFGAANELGIFEMTGTGLVPVANPSELFLQERPQGVAGSVVTACMEGTRPLLVEVQALVSGSKYGTGRRMTQGVDTNRVALLIAMLEKRLGFHLIGDDVFVNVAGGLEIDEPAVDLGVVAAISSSFKNAAIDAQTAVFGEVGLTGEVRGAMQASARAREAQALGFKKIIMPASNTAGLERLLGLRVVGVRSVEEALDELF